MHGNGGTSESADSLVTYDQGCKAQESLRCTVIVWDEATMSNKLALEAVERSFQDIREISAPLVALQWSTEEIFMLMLDTIDIYSSRVDTIEELKAEFFSALHKNYLNAQWVVKEQFLLQEMTVLHTSTTSCWMTFQVM